MRGLVPVLAAAILGLAGCRQGRPDPVETSEAETGASEPRGPQPVKEAPPLVVVKGTAPSPGAVAETSLRFAAVERDHAWACELDPSGGWHGRCVPLPPASGRREVQMHDGESGAPFVLEVDHAPMLLVEGKLAPLGTSDAAGRGFARASGEVFVVQPAGTFGSSEPARLLWRQGEERGDYPLPATDLPYWELQLRGEQIYFVRDEVLHEAVVRRGGLEQEQAMGAWEAGLHIDARCRVGERTVLMAGRARPSWDEDTIRKVRLFVQDRAGADWATTDLELNQPRTRRRAGVLKTVAPAPRLSCSERSVRLTTHRGDHLELVECVRGRCETQDLQLDFVEDPARTQFAWLGDRLVLVSDRAPGKVELRIGPPATISSAPATVLIDRATELGADHYRLVGAGEDAILIVVWDNELYALWIGADGSFGPVAAD